jgi:hypothetical protein
LFNDNQFKLDTNSAYQNLLSNFSPTKSTWGPYALGAYTYPNGRFSGSQGSVCGFQVAAFLGSTLKTLPNVDVVFTSDKSKWTRCAVVEMAEDPTLAEGKASRYYLRNHKGWNLDFESDGTTPKYSDDAADMGMSWFPGYAINQLTGERLNIVFGEDS